MGPMAPLGPGGPCWGEDKLLRHGWKPAVRCTQWISGAPLTSITWPWGPMLQLQQPQQKRLTWAPFSPAEPGGPLGPGRPCRWKHVW